LGGLMILISCSTGGRPNLWADAGCGEAGHKVATSAPQHLAIFEICIVFINLERKRQLVTQWLLCTNPVKKSSDILLQNSAFRFLISGFCFLLPDFSILVFQLFRFCFLVSALAFSLSPVKTL
jgi:hypothetical protein